MRNFIIFIIFNIFFQIIYGQNTSDYVFIKGGKFKMGSENDIDELPIHKVKISAFYVLNHEVTNAEYCQFLNDEGNQFENHVKWINLNGKWQNEKCRIYEKDSIFYVENGYENYPVVFVNWWGANAFCNWVGGRLPTEAEWEYLAYLSTENIEFNVEYLEKYAVFKNNSNGIYSEIKSKNKNSIEIYDLFGNLSEWCNDWYSYKYYSISKKTNPQGPKNGVQKVKRGGSWVNKSSSISVTNRKASASINYNITVGFRVVIPLE